MKDIHEKSYSIVTFSIKFSSFWIRKYIEISQKKTMRYTVIPWADIPLSDNQQSLIDNYKLTTHNYQRNINICDNFTQKTEIRKITQK
ncbi:hypothetical protein C6497_11870 [Candidatus Poribacteria bacterium]|nr:MAG: hypothetical protein C6497_11870 [Candidatus Poribacteria bacterium]